MTIIDRNPFLASLNYTKGQILTRLGLRHHFSGTTTGTITVEQSVAYIRGVVDDYIHYGADGDLTRLRGKHVLEVGPGDNLGVALLLIAKGAETVTCIDGFDPPADAEKIRAVYCSLLDGMVPEEAARVANTLRDGLIVDDRIRPRYRTPIEGAIRGERFDLILSRAVLEHVEDIRAGWRAMVASLRPGGEMWHKVDFRSHKYYEGIHPLYFLTIADPIWRIVSRPDPTMNRERLPFYREELEKARSARIYYTHILDKAEILPHAEELVGGVHYTTGDVAGVRAIRSKLARQFRNYTDEELLVTGIFLTATYS